MEDDPRLEVLHDHYKETFSYIRERERQRDRLFLILIGLFAVLVFEIQYPASFGSALDKASVFGAQVDLEGLPLPGLLSASWVLVLAIALRYCQAAINVERQYGYLHGLENKISKEIGDEAIYRREGAAYLEEYPAFQDWAWICYVFVFPIVAALATAALIGSELVRLAYPVPSKVFDALMAAAVVFTFYLYRWHPPGRTFSSLVSTLKERWQAGREEREKKHQ